MDSLDQRVLLALRLQSDGDGPRAEEVLRAVLQATPKHADALDAIALIAHGHERLEEASALVERTLRLEAERADWHSALGSLLLRQGSTAAAEAAFRDAIHLNPSHAEAYKRLKDLLTVQGRVNEAFECRCRAIVANPRLAPSRRMLGYAHVTLGQIEKAIEVYRQWLDEEPENPIARHMLAACSGRDVPTRAADDFLERTFDDFASSFEARLAMLSYRAPALIVAMLEHSGIQPSRSLDVLDAGCGTGLCGQLVARYARRLVGVDLSKRMMARAAEKQIYDELVHAELTAYLRDCRRTFDVIVAADTLIYFGTLDQIVSAAATALRPGGHLVFAIEELPATFAAQEFHLMPHGRYNHTRAYVQRVLEAERLQPRIVRADLRKEAGVAVAGLVIGAEKPNATLLSGQRGRG